MWKGVMRTSQLGRYEAAMMYTVRILCFGYLCTVTPVYS